MEDKILILKEYYRQFMNARYGLYTNLKLSTGASAQDKYIQFTSVLAIFFDTGHCCPFKELG